MPKRDRSALVLLIVGVLLLGTALLAIVVTAMYSAPGADPFAVLQRLAPYAKH